MRNRHRKMREPKYLKPLRVMMFALLSYIAIQIGVIGGNVLSRGNLNIAQYIGTESLRQTLNSSLPLIDTIYNSGKRSISFSGNIKDIVKSIFMFDPDDPISILNVQSAYLFSYYNNGYKLLIAKDSIDNSLINNNKSEGNNIQKNETSKEYIEDASSICLDNEIEKRDLFNSDLVSYGKISVLNETNYKIDIDKLINEPLNFVFNKNTSKILVFHTHTTESYIMDINELNQSNVPNRNRDPRYNVVRVGEELAENLRKKYKIDVIHNGTTHDLPNYNNSYTRSLSTVQNILKSYPSIQLVFDIHRDGLANGEKFRTVTEIDGKKVARIMFVVATGEIGLKHPNWRENLKLALKLQARLNEQSPDLARSIYISEYRYNQHLSDGAVLVEIGGDGNLLEECIESTKYLAKAINDVIIHE